MRQPLKKRLDPAGSSRRGDNFMKGGLLLACNDTVFYAKKT
jgi:hypothetical protein